MIWPLKNRAVDLRRDVYKRQGSIYAGLTAVHVTYFPAFTQAAWADVPEIATAIKAATEVMVTKRVLGNIWEFIRNSWVSDIKLFNNTDAYITNI